MHSFTIPWSVCCEQHNWTGNQIITSVQLNLNKSYNKGHMAKNYNNASLVKFNITKQWINSSTSSGPSHAINPTGSWLGERPSSRSHRRILPLIHSRQSLTKLIARDKAVSTFGIALANHLSWEICKHMLIWLYQGGWLYSKVYFILNKVSRVDIASLYPLYYCPLLL
jgi:hypothetical protein